MTVELYPAIDLLDGRVVRLEQGSYDRPTAYGDDPVATAVAFADAGARWIHVVDLDAAREGSPVNRPIVAAVAAAVRGTAVVQSGGGVRTLDDVVALAAAGVGRAVMGSAALRDRALVARAAEVMPVAVGLDHRGGRLAVHGWTETSEVTLEEALGWFPAAAAFVVTDIARDGMLAGPDIEGLRRVATSTRTPVVASGGVASIDDVRELAGIPGIAGVITGRALYEGRFDVRAAVTVLRAADSQRVRRS